MKIQFSKSFFYIGCIIFFFFSFFFVVIPFFLRVFFKVMNRLITIIRCLRCSFWISFFEYFSFEILSLLFAWFIKVVFRSISKNVVTSMNFIEEKWGQCVWLQAQERATSADGFYRGGNEQETKATNFVHPPGFGIVKRSLRQKYSS